MDGAFPADLPSRLPCGLVLLAGDGLVLAANAAADRLLGTALAGQPRDGWRRRLGQAGSSLLRLEPGARAVVMVQGRLLEVECQACGDEGRRLWLITDVSEELRLRAVLAEQATAFTEGTDAFLVVDGDGNVLYANPVAERERGFERGGLVGVGIVDLEWAADGDGAPQADPVLVQARLARVLAEGIAHRYQAWHRARDGRSFPVAAELRPYRMGDRRVALLIARDESERLRQVQALMDARAEAEASSRAKTAFLGVTSHELRTPLTSIIGFCELLQLDRGTDPAMGPYLARIHEAGDRLRTLIDSIVEFSRIEGQTLKLEVAEVDLAGLARQAAACWRPRAEAAGLEFALGVPDGADLRIESDAGRIRQVLDRLLDNAVKFSASGRIGLDVGPAGDGVHLLVSDQGPGIPPGQRDHLFKPFAQGDGSSTRRASGTGLGLYLARRLAQLLGGDLALQQTGPGGSVFRVALPQRGEWGRR